MLKPATRALIRRSRSRRIGLRNGEHRRVEAANFLRQFPHAKRMPMHLTYMR